MNTYDMFDFLSFFISFALILTNLVLSVFNYKTNLPKKTKTGLVNELSFLNFLITIFCILIGNLS
jgi:hypothetical protein